MSYVRTINQHCPNPLTLRTWYTLVQKLERGIKWMNETRLTLIKKEDEHWLHVYQDFTINISLQWTWVHTSTTAVEKHYKNAINRHTVLPNSIFRSQNVGIKTKCLNFSVLIWNVFFNPVWYAWNNKGWTKYNFIIIKMFISI